MTGHRVAVVGAGPAGTALALGLLGAGHRVTLVSDRTPEQIAAGRVASSQITFESALEVEAALGLAELLPEPPPVERLRFTGPGGSFDTPLPVPARSVDQRIRLPLLLRAVAERGGEVVVQPASRADLVGLAAAHDLVVVSTGRGGLADMFEVDADRTPYRRPQRVAALTYLDGVDPTPELTYRVLEGVGECFTAPALSLAGRCTVVVVEGLPGGPLDRWDDVADGPAHLARLHELLAERLPEEAARLRGARLADDRAWLIGRIAPVVRRPVGRLPDGTPVLGMADAVVLNDPATSQGANNALKSAASYLEAITRHRGRFDEDWMEQTFDDFWRGWAQWATTWTNDWLAPLAAHQRDLLAAAARHPGVAERIAAGFDDARLFHPWWFEPEAAERFLAEQVAAERARFAAADLRRALGQYATGVTVVTTATDGERFGMTANSFTSVSLDPPLVLWAAARTSPSLPAFEAAPRFAVNVLASDQHHLSRRFATSGTDKFAGVRLLVEDPPVLAGTVAHFVCRRTSRIEAGDHVVFLGEIESFQAPGGEPLVFHSGFYRVATRHPDL